MGRTPCCEKKGLKKGAWTLEEDKKLAAYVEEHGHGSWRSLPAKAGLQRCGKSCRLRWINYLKPDIKRGNFSLEEDRIIIQLHALLGNKWSLIAAHLHKRTDNEIKNYWNSHLKKRLIRMGIDPITHKAKANTTGHYSKDVANMSHMAQWESARLQAEARESMSQVGSSSSFSTSSHPTRLTISKIPPKPSPPPCLDVLKAWQQSLGSLESPSTNHHNNNNTMYDMYAIMLATDNNDLHSSVPTLSFPESKKLPAVSSTDACQSPKSSSSPSFENNDGNNNVDTSSHKMREGIVCSTEDGDIMVAVEAFRAARRRDEGISEVPNGAIEGLNNDMPVFECLAEEYGYGNFNLEANYCWTSQLLNEKHYTSVYTCEIVLD